MTGLLALHRPDPARYASTPAARQGARRHRGQADGRAGRRARACERRGGGVDRDRRRAHRRGGARARLRRDHDPCRSRLRHRPPRGGRRAARACRRRARRQRPGRRAADPVRSRRARSRTRSRSAPRRRSRPPALPIDDTAELLQPERGQGGVRSRGLCALFQPRARFPTPAMRSRPGSRRARRSRAGCPVFRHLGIYAYRAGFLRAYARHAPAADRAIRGTRAVARALARAPHRRARRRARPAARRRYAGGPGAHAAASSRARRFDRYPASGLSSARRDRRRPRDNDNQRNDHASHPARPARRRQRDAGPVHHRALQDPADLDRRHAARRGEGRHAARPRGQEGDGRGTARLRRHRRRAGEGAAALARLRAAAISSTVSRARCRRRRR